MWRQAAGQVVGVYPTVVLHTELITSFVISTFYG